MTDTTYSAFTPPFKRRHIGPSATDVASMLAELHYSSLDELVTTAVPASILDTSEINLPDPLPEHEAMAELKTMMARNQLKRSCIGMGYYDCITPTVIQRNILENPGWYTQYTPYQAEIAQGRLEALFNFQTMVADLTGLEIANASLLDEGTAAAEAMTMCRNFKKRSRPDIFYVADNCHPQTIEVVRTRALPLGIELRVTAPSDFDLSAEPFGLLVSLPATDGEIADYRDLFAKARETGCMTVAVTDLLACCLMEGPGHLGADVAVGNSQRFGVPLGFGGPHAGFFATRDEFKRKIPGRIVGLSIDADNQPAFRLALATREQHIRREKATSNICTAQVLLAVMAGMYAVYHGPNGLKEIASTVNDHAQSLASGLSQLGLTPVHSHYFDTLRVDAAKEQLDALMTAALNSGFNLRRLSDTSITISLDETTSDDDVLDLIEAAASATGADAPGSLFVEASIPESLQRKTPYMEHEVFHQHRSESEMMRYIRKLEARDLSLTRSMIPLGSCTMKLNAASELMPVSWSEVGGLHPFAPADQVEGYTEMFQQLESWLAEITGFSAVSLQPNSGAQGEYAGLLVIREYHLRNGDDQRDICLIPSSAHGTNPASAALAGMDIVVVKCDDDGNIDIDDLRKKAEANADKLSALMVTYPSTHGVFEEGIVEICEIVHQNGGQVYMDGANLQAQIGVCKAGRFGPDVCHLNLHKTFSIPHGGGGPGMGPIAVKEHLAPYLPGHPLAGVGGNEAVGPVSAAPWGSSSILVISWMYIRMMGNEGLRDATRIAILNANYIAHRLEEHYPVVYRGNKGLVAHECIIDLKGVHHASGVDESDVAKRLMDYGFHAPTVSWPVPRSMMIEPTESESKPELDRFCDAMISIREEIRAIEEGRMPAEGNVLKHAPHTAQTVVSDTWDRPYSRELAAFPLPWVRENKFWPYVSRIDNVYGDRNLVCTCQIMLTAEDQ